MTLTQVQYASGLCGGVASSDAHDVADLTDLAHLRLPPRTPSPKPAAKPLSKLSCIADSSTASEAESAVPAFNPDDFLARAERRAKERLEAATLAHAAKRAEEEKERAAIARKELYDEERDEFFLPDPIDVVAPPPPPPSVAHAIFDANGQIQDDENEREFAESTRILDARGEEIRRQMAELAEEEAALSQLVEADAALRKELERRLELASRARLVLSSLLEMMVNGTEDPELESAPHHHLLAVDEKSSAPPQTSASRSFAAP